MKNLYLLCLCSFCCYYSFANPTNSSVPQSGNWRIPATWQLGRIPMHGDTVLIPTGKTVVIDNIQNLGSEDLFIKVYGTLLLSGGKLWLGPNSTITIYAGGIVSGVGSPSETLKIGDLIKYEGSQLPLAGPLQATSTTGISPAGFAVFTETPLSVKFIGFNVARQNNNILVQWATTEEINNAFFEVERSENGMVWTTVATVPAGSSSSGVHSYSFTDGNAGTPLLYYRIRQFDLDGKSSFTSVKMIKNVNGQLAIKIGSAGTDAVYIHFSEKINSRVMVRLLTPGGQQVGQQLYTNPVGQLLIPVSSHVKGIYIVSVIDGRGLSFAKQVLL